MTADFVGIIAAIMTTGAFLPQVIKTYRTRDVDGISLVMYIVLCVGFSTWAMYGLMIGSIPVISANVVVLFLALAILVMKIMWGRKQG